MIAFDNSYARLPERFYARLPATPVKAPTLRAWNEELATELKLPEMAEAERAAIFGGNETPPGADPLAALYAGHQFGNWNPQLGDGRAILLGEVIGKSGQRWDIQLKGSGPTPFSRMGDGRNWVGPALREYLVSEAMHALGIPTTRALAIVTTGEPVLREAALPGAVVTRVARSHIRVGTFQVFASRGDIEALEALTAHVIERHYPEADSPRAMLQAVVDAQAKLIAKWMSVGFIHGVMNTDNAHVAGDTIDYGPCAFMDAYDPGKVFSSIDHGGRYAYANQPNIAAWNMAQLATALLPLMSDRDAAIEDFTEIVNSFAETYQAAWRSAFGAKLGLTHIRDEDVSLISEFLTMIAEADADFTSTFRALAEGSDADDIADHPQFDEWYSAWTAQTPDLQLMQQVNPAIIPRNHRVEQAIQSAIREDWSFFSDLHQALKSPYKSVASGLTLPPTADQEVRQTFCGT